ncbi:MAG: thioredoxin family protein [Deltaproteobacteria bacterium]|nr:thioredoxin family protein [Deltaproteobacteria bacterium]
MNFHIRLDARRRTLAPALLVCAAVLLAGPRDAAADGVVGQPAPAFTLSGTDGRPHSLAEYAGKYVVLEWLNHDCPFVRKHYVGGNMQRLQKKWTGRDVVWLSINSSAPGKQGNYPPEEANELTSDKGAAPTAVLLDPDGTVGRAYGAKTTPHMFVVDPKGVLIYAGGIDDKPSTDPADVGAARNHVDHALTEALDGKPVTVAASTPYGCSVKY